MSSTVPVVKVELAKYSMCGLLRMGRKESLSPQRSDIPDVSEN